MLKNPPTSAGDIKDVDSIPVGKMPWRKEGMGPSPVFLPGESHGQEEPEDYSPRGRKESTE